MKPVMLVIASFGLFSAKAVMNPELAAGLVLVSETVKVAAVLLVALKVSKPVKLPRPSSPALPEMMADCAALTLSSKATVAVLAITALDLACATALQQRSGRALRTAQRTRVRRAAA